MFWVNFLHFYQPPDQSKLMLEKVVNEGYRPLIAVLKKHKKAKMTFNFSACLTELLDKAGYQDVISAILDLLANNQIEFTASAKFHPFLPLLPKKEILRQIELNETTNKKYFGKYYQPSGFYSPEAGYSLELVKLVNKLGYKWTIVDEVSYSGRICLPNYNFSKTLGFYSSGQDLGRIVGTVTAGKLVDYSKVYKIKGIPGFNVFFRERVISDALASGQIKSADQFLEVLGEEKNKNRYLLTGTDGEAYGHHQPGLEKVLDELLERQVFKTVTISQLPKIFKQAEEILPNPSSWGTSEKEVEAGNYYSRWWHPANYIHKLQWEFTNFAIQLVEKYKDGRTSKWLEARNKMDIAEYSCHFWWASAHPWWSIEMIERGAYALLDVVKSLPTAASAERRKAKRYYSEITETAFDWLRREIVWDLSHQHS